MEYQIDIIQLPPITIPILTNKAIRVINNGTAEPQVVIAADTMLIPISVRDCRVLLYRE